MLFSLEVIEKYPVVVAEYKTKKNPSDTTILLPIKPVDTLSDNLPINKSTKDYLGIDSLEYSSRPLLNDQQGGPKLDLMGLKPNAEVSVICHIDAVISINRINECAHPNWEFKPYIVINGKKLPPLFENTINEQQTGPNLTIAIDGSVDNNGKLKINLFNNSSGCNRDNLPVTFNASTYIKVKYK